MIRQIKGIGEEAEKIVYSYRWSGNGYEVREEQGGRWKKEVYDGYGRVIGVEDSGGEEVAYEYTSRGKIAKRMRGGEEEESYEYDGIGNMIRKIGGNGGEEEYEYTGFGEISVYRNEIGGERKYKYNDKYELVGVAQANGGEWEYEYDEYGRIEKRIDPENRWEKYEYDWLGRTARVEDGGGVVREYEYDWQGNVIGEEGIQGKVEYGYSSMGLMEYKIDGENNRWEYEYNVLGAMVASEDPEGGRYEWEYNSAGQLVEERNQLGDIQSYEYKDGLLETTTHFEGGSIGYSYTANGRIEEIEYGDDDRVRYEYTNKGEIERVTRQDYWVKYSYDKGGQVVGSEDSNGVYKSYEYDAMGNVVGRREGSIREQRSYDSMGLLQEIVYGDGSWEKISYDTSGKKERSEKSNGVVEEWEYDGGGRMRYWRERGDDSIGEGYIYDERGRLTGSINYEGEVKLYDYDKAGRLVRTREHFSSERAAQAYRRYLESGYFPDSEGSSPEFLGDEKYRALVSELGELYVGDEMERFGIKQGRNPTDFAGRLQMGERAQPLEDVLQELDRVSRRQRSGMNVWEEEYSYDTRGNMVKIRNGWGTTSLEYDTANRLIQRGSRRYSYDRAGNLLQERLLEAQIDYEYNTENRTIRIEANKENLIGAGKSIEYGYDGLGRRERSITENEVGQSVHIQYTYDRLSMYMQSEREYVGYEEGIRDQSDAELGWKLPEYENWYLPDVNTKREVRRSNDTWYTPEEREEEKEPVRAAQQIKRWYSYGNDGAILYAFSALPHYGGDQYGAIERGASKGTSHRGSVFYTRDMLGSVRSISDEYGTRLSQYEYSAYGDRYGGDGALAYGIGYTGKQEIEGMQGVYNYGFRDYRSYEGRFSTEDPIKDGTNWYLYVAASPTNFVDPWGLCMSNLECSYSGTASTSMTSEDFNNMLDIAEQVFSAAGSIPDSVVGGRLGTAGTVVETARDIADPNTSLSEATENFARGLVSGAVGGYVGGMVVGALTIGLAPTAPVIIVGAVVTLGVSSLVDYAWKQARKSSSSNTK